MKPPVPAAECWSACAWTRCSGRLAAGRSQPELLPRGGSADHSRSHRAQFQLENRSVACNDGLILQLEAGWLFLDSIKPLSHTPVQDVDDPRQQW